MVMVQDVMNALTRAVGHIENTVDTLKMGDPTTEVTGIACAFMPTFAVLQRATHAGLNLVVAHEAPFYHHLDNVDVLQNDPVYAAKHDLIQQSGISIFRLHDHMHRHKPDLIEIGLAHELDWADYMSPARANDRTGLHTFVLAIPTTTVRAVAEHVKRKLGVPFVRVVGHPDMPCSRVGLLPGYRGGGSLAIPFFHDDELDVIIAGEGPEWETPEYVRDAVAQGLHKALIVVGHSKSEECGMKGVAAMLRSTFPATRIEFIPDEQPFQLL